MGTKCKDYVVLYLDVFRISQVVYMEELLNLAYTLLGKIYDLILLIYDEVSCLLLDDTHDGIHL